jgi:hypothetical protein
MSLGMMVFPNWLGKSKVTFEAPNGSDMEIEIIERRF